MKENKDLVSVTINMDISKGKTMKIYTSKSVA